MAPRSCARVGTGALAAAAVLAGCGWRGPSLAGHPGLQWEVISFYGGRAMEENAVCPQPRITAVTRARVVEETPERVVMDVRYRYQDDGMTSDSGGSGGSTKLGCAGFGGRRFTFARGGDGGLDPVAMTGPQRSSR
jgi:hypothetical protein